MDGITDSMDMNLGKLQVMVRDREVWCAAVHRVEESDPTWRLNNKHGHVVHLCYLHLCPNLLPTLTTLLLLLKSWWDFPGSPVVRTWAFSARDPDLIPGQETKIPQVQHGKKKKINVN